jgi:hypothetical protein
VVAELVEEGGAGVVEPVTGRCAVPLYGSDETRWRATSSPATTSPIEASVISMTVTILPAPPLRAARRTRRSARRPCPPGPGFLCQRQDRQDHVEMEKEHQGRCLVGVRSACSSFKFAQR